MRTGLAAASEHFTYADAKARLDARAVLEHYGAQNCHDELNKDKITTEVIHSCLIDEVEPHHANGDANPSAACNVDKKTYACYVYWSGDLLHFIMKMERKEELGAVTSVIGRFLGESFPDADEFRSRLEKLLAAGTLGAYGLEPQAYSERLLAPWAFIHPYLATRGIDDETASRLRIGWREDQNRITIPVWWRGNLVGWQLRSLPDCPGLWPGTWGGGVPKYRSSPGFPKSQVLYRYDDARSERPRHLGRRRCIVVESPFSVIKSVALGVPGVVATFGAKVSDRQAQLLREFDEVVIWADADDAGRVMERRLVSRLHDHTSVRVVTPDSGVDLGDLDSADLIMEKIDAAIPAVLKQMEWSRGG